MLKRIQKKKSEINIGEKYQAKIPRLLKTKEDKKEISPYEEVDELLWNPELFPEEREGEFDKKMEEVLKVNKIISREAAIVYVMQHLTQNNYNLDQFLQQDFIVPNEERRWTNVERCFLKQNLRKYEKDFYLLSKSIKTKDTSEIVKYYYLHKYNWNNNNNNINDEYQSRRSLTRNKRTLEAMESNSVTNNNMKHSHGHSHNHSHNLDINNSSSSSSPRSPSSSSSEMSYDDYLKKMGYSNIYVDGRIEMKRMRTNEPKRMINRTIGDYFKSSTVQRSDSNNDVNINVDEEDDVDVDGEDGGADKLTNSKNENENDNDVENDLIEPNFVGSDRENINEGDHGDGSMSGSKGSIVDSVVPVPVSSSGWRSFEYNANSLSMFDSFESANTNSDSTFIC